MPGDWTGFFRQWEPLRALEQEGWGDLKGEVDGTGLVMLQSGAVSPCPPARQPGGGGGGRIFRFLSVVLEDSVDPEAAQSPQDFMGPLPAKAGLVWASSRAEAYERCPCPWGRSHLCQILARTPALPHGDLTSPRVCSWSSCRLPGFLTLFLDQKTGGLCWPLCLESPPLASSPDGPTHSRSLFVLVHGQPPLPRQLRQMHHLSPARTQCQGQLLAGAPSENPECE